MKPENDFDQIAANKKESSFMGELWSLIRGNKKYWMVPILIVLLLLGLLVVLSGTAVAPFIYTLF
jgi:fluoride ion exporter CrcB/FEX